MDQLSFNADFKKGLQRVMLYYLAGIIVTITFHVIIGWEYKFLLPMSMVIFVLVLIIALPWMILNLINLHVRRHPRNFGELVAHGIIFLTAGFILYLGSTH